MEKETDYQRARRQRSEVKKYGITGSTSADASKRIKEHAQSKHNALQKKKGNRKGMSDDDYLKELDKSGGFVPKDLLHPKR